MKAPFFVRVLGLFAMLSVALFVASAQPESHSTGTPPREAIARLAFLDGRWEGEGWTEFGPGRRFAFRQTEKVGPLLGGDIRLIEGRGYDKSGVPRFGAFGVLSFNPDTQAYLLNSWAMGRGGEFEVQLTPPGTVVWTMDSPAGRTVYTITVKDEVWHEIGERVDPSGGPAVTFFEMTLHRTGDASWDESAAPVPPSP